MGANEVEKLQAEQAAAVIPPVERRVGNNRVITRVGMSEKPSSAVVDVDPDLGVAHKRLHHRVLRKQLKISRVNFHGIEHLRLGMICEDLRPRTGGQANHKNTFWSRTESA